MLVQEGKICQCRLQNWEMRKHWSAETQIQKLITLYTELLGLPKEKAFTDDIKEFPSLSNEEINQLMMQGNA